MRNIKFKNKNYRSKSLREGFMLVELMMAVLIMVIVFVGYLHLFIYCLSLAETSRNITLANAEAQNKLEEMRNRNPDTVVADYSSGGFYGDTFNLTQLNGTGTIYFPAPTIADLINVEIVIAWTDSKNRAIGGTDTDGDTRIDSPVELKSIIVRM
jgi:type II secretory pathway pseudopilin PulG